MRTKYILIYVITKSMRALCLFNQLWFFVQVNSWKNRAFSELLYRSKRPQVSMLYSRVDKPLEMLEERDSNNS